MSRLRALPALAASLLFLAAWAPLGGTPLAAQEPPSRRRGPPELRGVTLPLHSKDPSHDYGPALRELPGHGVAQVCVTVHVYQEHGDSPAPARHPTRTPSDGVIRRVLQQAREAGLEVTLLPIVLLESPRKEDWRGNLLPPDSAGRERRDPSYLGPDWERWFRGYGEVIRHYARLAEEGRVALFCVGSELSSTEDQGERWKALIREVRGLFSGELTYSANWDHYRRVPFWRELDYIGLSGYYELTRTSSPTPEELERAWVKVRGRLLAWREKAGLSELPLLFTELGYPSIDGCASKPWDYTAQAPVDLGEQADCYAAFVRCWDGRPELAGVFFYEWWGEGGQTDSGYTPRGKPALEVLRRWYGAPAKR